jgi:hypothetical protein
MPTKSDATTAAYTGVPSTDYMSDDWTVTPDPGVTGLGSAYEMPQNTQEHFAGLSTCYPNAAALSGRTWDHDGDGDMDQDRDGDGM